MVISAPIIYCTHVSTSDTYMYMYKFTVSIDNQRGGGNSILPLYYP